MFNKKEALYKSALEKYAGKHLLELIEINKEKQIKLQGEVKDLTVAFYNIIDYQALTAEFKPQFLIELLYKYYDAVFEGIEKNGGFVLNINGDEVISFFGDECSNPGLNAVLSYYDSVKILNEYLKSTGDLSNIIGTGINCGEIIIGNFGSDTRMFYSVMGEHVNLANRLLNSNKLYKTNIIISDFIYQRIKNELVVRELDLITVSGLKGPHKIYEVLSLK